MFPDPSVKYQNQHNRNWHWTIIGLHENGRQISHFFHCLTLMLLHQEENEKFLCQDRTRTVVHTQGKRKKLCLIDPDRLCRLPLPYGSAIQRTCIGTIEGWDNMTQADPERPSMITVRHNIIICSIFLKGSFSNEVCITVVMRLGQDTKKADYKLTQSLLKTTYKLTKSQLKAN